MMEIICPVCSHSDSTQEVSVIVANGQSSGNTSGSTGEVAYSINKWESVGGVTNISREASIELARKLLPPSEPVKKGGIGCKWILSIVLVIILFAISIIFTAIFLRNLVPLNNSLSSSTSNISEIILIICILGIISSLLIFLLYKGIDMLSKKYKESNQKEEEIYLQEKLRWEAAMNKWNCAYYCHRDGVVFDNKAITVCRLEQFREFLFS